MIRRPVLTEQAPSAVGPYSQAIRTEKMVFASGQLGLDPGNGQLVEGVEAQTRQALANLSAVLRESGSSMEQIVKTTIFLASKIISRGTHRHIKPTLELNCNGTSNLCKIVRAVDDKMCAISQADSAGECVDSISSAQWADCGA